MNTNILKPTGTGNFNSSMPKPLNNLTFSSKMSKIELPKPLPEKELKISTDVAIPPTVAKYQPTATKETLRLDFKPNNVTNPLKSGISKSDYSRLVPINSEILLQQRTGTIQNLSDSPQNENENENSGDNGNNENENSGDNGNNGTNGNGGGGNNGNIGGSGGGGGSQNIENSDKDTTYQDTLKQKQKTINWRKWLIIGGIVAFFAWTIYANEKK